MNVFSILVGGGILAFIQFLISRHDQKKDKVRGVYEAIEKLSAKIDQIDRKEDQRSAINMRVRILHFRDEMLAGQNHTHDSFQQVLSDIDEYERYCDMNAGFRNNQTVATIEHIKKNYQERLVKHDFL